MAPLSAALRAKSATVVQKGGQQERFPLPMPPMVPAHVAVQHAGMALGFLGDAKGLSPAEKASIAAKAHGIVKQFGAEAVAAHRAGKGGATSYRKGARRRGQAPAHSGLAQAGAGYSGSDTDRDGM